MRSAQDNTRHIIAQVLADTGQGLGTDHQVESVFSHLSQDRVPLHASNGLHFIHHEGDRNSLLDPVCDLVHDDLNHRVDKESAGKCGHVFANNARAGVDDQDLAVFDDLP